MKTLAAIVKREGRCYELALRVMIEEAESKTFTLVHGQLDLSRYGLASNYKHAWIELQDGFVYDTNLAKYMLAAEYAAKYRPSKCARYTKRQVFEMMLKYNYAGPWE